MIALLGGGLSLDAPARDRLSFVLAFVAALLLIFGAAWLSRNAKTFWKALAAATLGFLIALGAADWFFSLGKNDDLGSSLSRVEILGAPTIIGAEDVAVVPGDPVRLLISATDNARAASETDGALYLLDPQRPYAPLKPLILEDRDGCSFRPHGIDVIQDGEGTWIFVINHHLARDTDPERGCQPALHAAPKPMESIEIFRYRGPYLPLQFAERLEDSKLGHPNDLAAVGRRHLLVTVPEAKPGEIWNGLLAMVGAPPTGHCSGRVVDWNHGVWSEPAKDLCYPNGIAVQPPPSVDPLSAASNGPVGGPVLSPASRAARAFWVATSLDGKLHRIPPLPQGDLSGEGAPDNLSWAGTDLLVALHKDKVQFAAAALSAGIDGPPISSPGCVLRLRFPAEGSKEVWKPNLTCPPETKANPDFPYRGNGERMSAVSSGACVGPDLFLGQVFERGIGRVAGGCAPP